MTISFHNIHSFEFAIDTADWTDEPSREIAERSMIDFLRSLSDDEAEELHAILQDKDLDNAYSSEEMVPPAIHIRKTDAENEAAKLAFAGWMEWPDYGHNTFIKSADNA